MISVFPSIFLMFLHFIFMIGFTTALFATFNPFLNNFVFRSIRLRHPESYLKTPEIISYYGYTSETHLVKTEDDYFLEMFRIPRPKSATHSDPSGIPVILIHGYQHSSVSWILNSVNNSIGFLLADDGYDIWLGNLRGCTYSLHHASYSSDEEKFWNFSFDEHGRFDIPAMIDYVLHVTGRSQVILIGHSTGSTSIFAALSNRTEYNEKVKGFIALAPTIGLESHPSPVLLLFFNFIEIINTIHRRLGMYWLPAVPILIRGHKPGCPIRFPIVCRFINILITGIESPIFNRERIPIIYSHYPDIGSMKAAIHLKQIFFSANFMAFDYRHPERNKRKYGTEKPPVYDLRLISTPGILFSSSYNTHFALEAAEDIARRLPNVQLIRSVPFMVMDFLYSTNVKLVLYPPLRKALERLRNNDSQITTQAIREEMKPSTEIFNPTSTLNPFLKLSTSSMLTITTERNEREDSSSSPKITTDRSVELSSPIENTKVTTDESVELSSPIENTKFTTDESVELSSPIENTTFTTDGSVELLSPTENTQNITKNLYSQELLSTLSFINNETDIPGL